MNPRDQRKVEKIRGILAGATLGAARYLRDVGAGKHVDSGETKATNQFRANAMLVQGWQSYERAKTVSETPRQLGVVVVHERLEDTPQNRLAWEADAAALRDQRAIEAVPVKVKEPDAA